MCKAIPRKLHTSFTQEQIVPFPAMPRHAKTHMHISFNSISSTAKQNKVSIKIRFRLCEKDIYKIYYPSAPHCSVVDSLRSISCHSGNICCKIASACETSLENKISLLQHAKCLYELSELILQWIFFYDFALTPHTIFSFLSKRWMPHSNSSLCSSIHL